MLVTPPGRRRIGTFTISSHMVIRPMMNSLRHDNHSLMNMVKKEARLVTGRGELLRDLKTKKDSIKLTIILIIVDISRIMSGLQRMTGLFDFPPEDQDQTSGSPGATGNQSDSPFSIPIPVNLFQGIDQSQLFVNSSVKQGESQENLKDSSPKLDSEQHCEQLTACLGNLTLGETNSAVTTTVTTQSDFGNKINPLQSGFPTSSEHIVPLEQLAVAH